MGLMPVDAIYYLVGEDNYDGGIMITASHNPYYDNGLKLFGPDGLKLSDKIEKKIEGLIDKKIELTATCVRIPVLVSHSESVNIEFEKTFSLEKVHTN